MKRLFAILALVLAVPAQATLDRPPKAITPADAGKLHDAGRIEPVYLVDRLGRRPVIGFLLEGRASERVAGAYVWDAGSSAYIEFHAAYGGARLGELTLPVAATFRPIDRQLLREYIPTLYTTFRDARTNAPAAQPTRPATTVRPRPLPQPTHVKPTFLDRTLLATSSPIAAVWNEHRFLSILAFVLLGCVLGARARTGGPRPIEIRQDDVLAALAASERKLSASRARLQQLSSAIDAEESQFVQRVSAIVERR